MKLIHQLARPTRFYDPGWEIEENIAEITDMKLKYQLSAPSKNLMETGSMLLLFVLVTVMRYHYIHTTEQD